jgi:hypothetical protein
MNVNDLWVYYDVQKQTPRGRSALVDAQIEVRVCPELVHEESDTLPVWEPSYDERSAKAVVSTSPVTDAPIFNSGKLIRSHDITYCLFIFCGISRGWMELRRGSLTDCLDLKSGISTGSVTAKMEVRPLSEDK